MWNKRNKYGRKRVEKAGLRFDSKLESAVDDLLKLREKSGELEITGRQVRVTIEPLSGIQWIADFECKDLKTDDLFYIEAKGMETTDWRLKLRLIRAHFPYRVEIWKGSYKYPKLVEIIKPSFPVMRPE